MQASTIRDLSPLEMGGGTVEGTAANAARMTIPAMPRGYADAQLDDYHNLPRSGFLWQPPVRFSLRARASVPRPLGTLGFGFWNDPFSLSLGQGGAARRLPSAPQTAWFFYGSPPNHFAFADGIAGHGTKAMAIRSPRVPTLLLAPFAALGVLAAQLPLLRRPVMRAALRAVRSAEVETDIALDTWHRFSAAWEVEEVRFEIDGQVVLQERIPVPGPLGFVTWIDNQYAVASPEKGFRFGVIPTEQPQWLEIAELEIQAGAV